MRLSKWVCSPYRSCKDAPITADCRPKYLPFGSARPLGIDVGLLRHPVCKLCPALAEQKLGNIAFPDEADRLWRYRDMHKRILNR
jgi:hypothetical protein